MTNRIHVAYDTQGTIISASESKYLPLPEQEAGLTVGEFDVPGKFESKKPREYLHYLMVDTKARQLRGRTEK